MVGGSNPSGPIPIAMNNLNVHRRFEVLLPLQFNDGQAVPQAHFTETLAELRQRFGDLSIETQATRGLSQYGSQQFRDDLIRVYVDVPDLPEHRAVLCCLERDPQNSVPTTRYLVDDLSAGGPLTRLL